MILKKYRIIHTSDYTIEMLRGWYKHPCRGCKYNEEIMRCTQMYMDSNIRLCNVCGEFCCPICHSELDTPWSFWVSTDYRFRPTDVKKEV